MPWDGDRRQRGRQAETLACRHLERGGLTLIERNARAGRGEIDLVMRKDDTLIFVEVRARASGAPVAAAESLSTAKCAKVRETAQRLIARHPEWQSLFCRFDVVAVTIPDGSDTPQVDWLADAF